MLIQHNRIIQNNKTKATLLGIPSGISGIRVILRAMSKIVRKYKTNVQIRELALTIVRNQPAKCWICEAVAIQKYIYNTIRYVRDVESVETLSTPVKTLEYGQGDCDDMVILYASLLQSIGHPVRFAAVGFNGGGISHVLAETLIGNKWEPVELTVRMKIGDYPTGITSKLIQNIKP